MLRHFVVLLLCIGSAVGQSPLAVQSKSRYPRLSYAEAPLYPPAAWSAHLGGTIEIEITVENGAVVEAEVKGGTIEKQFGEGRSAIAIEGAQQSRLFPYLSLPSVANVKTWRFESGERFHFVVRYVYSIEGQKTQSPENPKVEIDFPRLVKITVRPFDLSSSGGSGQSRRRIRTDNSAAEMILHESWHVDGPH